jgi:hypothetical protein
MSKQTAVEWLVKQLNEKIDFIPMDKWDEIRDIVQQAKAMEKEQIENAFENGMNAVNIHNLEQYYNETYGGDKRTTTNKITLTGKNNSVLLTDISNTITINCKFQPIETYQNIGSSENSPCVKCGKKLWEHPIKTYGGNK